MKKEKIIRNGIFAIFGGLLFVYVAAKIQTAVQKPQEPTSISQYQTISCPEEPIAFKELADKDQVVKLLKEPSPMYVVNGVFERAKTIVTKNDTEKSKVACGYLYVKARTSEGALVSYQDVYINPDNFGGHIDSSNQFGPGDKGSEYSEYLFSLNDIRYWKSKNRGAILHSDWASLFNVSPTLTFIIALNTTDQGGIVDDVSIAYKCRDPITGEENTGCKLTASEPEFGKETLP